MPPLLYEYALCLSYLESKIVALYHCLSVVLMKSG